MYIKNFMGKGGFCWYVGFVEEIDESTEHDPPAMRVRVRPYGYYLDDVPTEELPWAQISLPTDTGGNFGIGVGPTQLSEGSLVWGFFLDAQEAQLPVVCGVLAGIGDVNNLGLGKVEGTWHESARANRKSSVPEVDWDEPETAFNAKYPNNFYRTTASGHAIEIDDTPGAERIAVHHKSGTYIEIDPDGRMVVRTTSNQVTVVDGDSLQYTTGKSSVSIDGDGEVYIRGSHTLKVAGDLNATISGSTNITSTGAILLDGSSVTLKSAANIVEI